MLRSKSIIATPPGTTIKEQLEDRGMTQKDFAARMGMSEKFGLLLKRQKNWKWFLEFLPVFGTT